MNTTTTYFPDLPAWKKHNIDGPWPKVRAGTNATIHRHQVAGFPFGKQHRELHRRAFGIGSFDNIVYG